MPANSPDAFPPAQFDLIAFCDDCGHSAPIDRVRIPPGLTIPELPARLRCTACGGRACSMRIVYTGAAATGTAERAWTRQDRSFGQAANRLA